jgi:hypothetical protein
MKIWETISRSRFQALLGNGELCVQAELGLQIAFPSSTWEPEQMDCPEGYLPAQNFGQE